MYNFPNNQLIVPNGTQMQQPIGFQAQIPQPYLEQPAQMPYPNDTFMPITSDYTTPGKSFWDGFKLVFTKIGEFCTKNFGLILTGAGLLGGYKFCSSSMKTYEENKNNGKLDDKGNLKDKDASIKDTIMNFVGHGVHYVFGSNKKDNSLIEEDENNKTKEKKELEDEKTDNSIIDKELAAGNITNLLKAHKTCEGKIKILEKITQKIENGGLVNSTHWDRRQTTIINTLQDLINNGSDDIKDTAKGIANRLSNASYFKEMQQEILKQLAKAQQDNT